MTHDLSLWPLEAGHLSTWLKPRPLNSHKGDHGHVLVVGGDYGMAGAVRLAAEAAYRMGAGLVSVATRVEHVNAIVSARPEVMVHGFGEKPDLSTLLSKASVVILGPGLGMGAWSYNLYTQVLQAKLPTLLDADALNLLAKQPTQGTNWVLTPHPGEAARLLQQTITVIQHDRVAAVSALQQQYQGTVVLKGAGTLIASANNPFALCRAGNPGMGSGGMGDALSGLIGGLMAQDLSGYESACLGVYIHSTAADRLAVSRGSRGILALDVIEEARYVSQLLTQG